VTGTVAAARPGAVARLVAACHKVRSVPACAATAGGSRRRPEPPPSLGGPARPGGGPGGGRGRGGDRDSDRHGTAAAAERPHSALPSLGVPRAAAQAPGPSPALPGAGLPLSHGALRLAHWQPGNPPKLTRRD
jgi:hypothetical protein